MYSSSVTTTTTDYVTPAAVSTTYVTPVAPPIATSYTTTTYAAPVAPLAQTTTTYYETPALLTAPVGVTYGTLYGVAPLSSAVLEETTTTTTTTTTGGSPWMWWLIMCSFKVGQFETFGKRDPEDKGLCIGFPIWGKLGVLLGSLFYDWVKWLGIGRSGNKIMSINVWQNPHRL